MRLTQKYSGFVDFRLCTHFENTSLCSSTREPFETKLLCLKLPKGGALLYAFFDIANSAMFEYRTYSNMKLYIRVYLKNDYSLLPWLDANIVLIRKHRTVVPFFTIRMRKAQIKIKWYINTEYKVEVFQMFSWPMEEQWKLN